jgi:hypothetical protein
MTQEDLDNIHALTRHPGWHLLKNDLQAMHSDCVSKWTAERVSDEESRRLQAKAREIAWLLARPQSLIERGTEATIEQEPRA